jgi:hypothetical protein
LVRIPLFSEIVSSDNENVSVETANSQKVLEDKEAILNTGEIVVSVHRKGKGIPVPFTKSTSKPKEISDVAEKALKGLALSHYTKYVLPIVDKASIPALPKTTLEVY